MNNPLMVEYAREPWMMEPAASRIFLSALSAINQGNSLAAVNVEMPLPIRVEGDNAVIPISGVLLKTVPGMLKLVFGSRITGYDDIRKMVQMAVADPAVQRIELRITSPGGQVAGGMETADAIRAADAVKPVTAVIEDLGASGAFWLATSARRIEANANAEVGSIGVYTYFVDWSKYEDDLGVKVIVVRSGEHKGMGLDKITESQIAAVQEIIDGMNAHFIDQVAAGRKVTRERAAEWATGRVWLAPAAVEMGLIDGITPSVQSITSQIKETTMSLEEKTPQPAVDTAALEKSAAESALCVERHRIGHLRAAFQNDPAFAMEAVSAGWDVTQAKAERHDRMEKAQAERPQGDPGLPYHDSTPGATKLDFIAEAKRLAKEEHISMTESMRRVQAENPEAYAKFLAMEEARPVRNRSGKAAAGRTSA